MRKIFVYILINLLVVNLCFAIDVKKLQYDASHFRNIESFYMIADGELSLNLSDYYYSLNDGEFSSFYAVNHDQGDTKLKILNLKLREGENNIKVIYKNEAPAEVKIHFLQPVLEIVAIGQGEGVLETQNGAYLVAENTAVNVEFKYDFPENTYGALWGPAAINTINYYFTSWQSTAVENIIVENFDYGLNELILEPLNNKNEKYGKDILKFFYSDFELPAHVWKKDTLIELTGKPEGGYFTGEGVVGNSNYFNPAEISSGLKTISYHYPFGDSEVVVQKAINVLSYQFSIEGELSVCKNATDVGYEILNFNPDFEYDWSIQGGKFLNINELNSRNLVEWDSEGTGSFGEIKIVATHIASGAQFYDEISIFLKNSIAYDKADFFFGDEDNRLVICEKTDAYKYLWSKDGSSDVETVTPYFYFDGPGNQYNLTLVTQEGCKTTISKSGGDLEKSGALVPNTTNATSVKINFDQKELNVYPNPVNNILWLVTDRSENVQTVRIFDDSSKCILTALIHKGEVSKELNIQHISSGKYIIQVSDGDKMVSKQFIKMQ